MSTIEEKNALRRDLWVRSEATRLASIQEAESIASLLSKPDMEARMQVWIKEETSRTMHSAMLAMRKEVTKNIKNEVQAQVSAYCKSAFDTSEHEGFIDLSAAEHEDYVQLMTATEPSEEQLQLANEMADLVRSVPKIRTQKSIDEIVKHLKEVRDPIAARLQREHDIRARRSHFMQLIDIAYDASTNHLYNDIDLRVCLEGIMSSMDNLIAIKEWTPGDGSLEGEWKLIELGFLKRTP